MPPLTGADARSLIEAQISAHTAGLTSVLARFNGRHGFHVWLATIRAVEEFINLPLFGLDPKDGLSEEIAGFGLAMPNPAALASIRSALVGKFGEPFAQRFTMTVIQASAIGTAFRMNGLHDAAAGFATIGHAVGYFQSRRRHLIAILYALPIAGTGKAKLQRLDTINQFLPAIEHSAQTLTGLYQKLMLADVFPDFTLEVDHAGFAANHDYEPLDSIFLEPERASIVEMELAITNGAPELEPVDPRLLFSRAELRNNIRLIEAAYAEFDLAGTAFGPVARMTEASLVGCRDDYVVKLGRRDFDRLAKKCGLSGATAEMMVHRGGDFVTNVNTVAPFIAVGDSYVSTVTLLGRYLYYWKSACLNRIRRFQIRAGFIFESNVKVALAKQGFTVTEVKRVNRKEFDVVATLDGVIYNLQCKNNLVDLSRIETSPSLFARYNRRLDRSYARALAKEEGREQLLKDKLGLGSVRHLVVSRFPIATVNPHVITFSHIDRLRERLGV